MKNIKVKLRDLEHMHLQGFRNFFKNLKKEIFKFKFKNWNFLEQKIYIDSQIEETNQILNF